VVDLFAVRDSARGIEAAFSGKVGAAFELVAAVGVCGSGVVVFGVWGIDVSVLVCISETAKDIPSGRLFKASFMARIVSAIWICCAAMAVRIAVVNFCRRNRESDAVYGVPTRELVYGITNWWC
jgi:hypothetical protein